MVLCQTVAERAAFRSFADLYASKPYWVKKRIVERFFGLKFSCDNVICMYNTTIITQNSFCCCLFHSHLEDNFSPY